MAITIDYEMLKDLDLDELPKSEKDKLLEQIYETLETRVGTRLTDIMSDDQLDEFEAFIDANDEAGAMEWLTKNLPGYPKVVQEELDKLKAEIKATAHQIKGAASDSNGK